MVTCVLFLLALLISVFGASTERTEDTTSPIPPEYVFVDALGRFSRTPSPAPIQTLHQALHVTDDNHFGEITSSTSLNSYQETSETTFRDSEVARLEGAAWEVREIVERCVEELISSLLQASREQESNDVSSTKSSEIESSLAATSNVQLPAVLKQASSVPTASSDQTSTASIAFGVLAIVAAILVVRNRN
jgi:hypothetical protein